MHARHWLAVIQGGMGIVQGGKPLIKGLARTLTLYPDHTLLQRVSCTSWYTLAS